MRLEVCPSGWGVGGKRCLLFSLCSDEGSSSLPPESQELGVESADAKKVAVILRFGEAPSDSLGFLQSRNLPQLISATYFY